MSESTALLLIPGTLNDASVWAPVVKTIGHNAPVCIADITQVESTAAMAEAALAQAQAAGISGRFALAGFSLGGYVAFEVLRRAGNRVSGLALISSSARPLRNRFRGGRRALPWRKPTSAR